MELQIALCNWTAWYYTQCSAKDLICTFIFMYHFLASAKHDVDRQLSHLEVRYVSLKAHWALLLWSSGAKPSYVNNASIPALQYHSPLVDSAWLNTNPMNLEVSANTHGGDYPLRSPMYFKRNVISWQRKNWNSQTFDSENLMAKHALVGECSAWRALMWTMCSQRAKRGWAGPGLHEQQFPQVCVRCTQRGTLPETEMWKSISLMKVKKKHTHSRRKETFLLTEPSHLKRQRAASGYGHASKWWHQRTGSASAFSLE